MSIVCKMNNLVMVSTTRKEMFTPKKYKVRSGTIDSGKEYETKITSLLALRCCFQELEHFWIAFNADGFGALDDIIVFKKGNEMDKGITYFMQLKHQDASKALVKDMFLGDSGDFSIKKYSKCYSEIQRMISDTNKKSDMLTHLRQNSEKVFIIFTNKSVSIERPGSTDKKFLWKINETEQLDGFDCKGDVFKIDYEALVEEPNINVEFLKKLYLFVNQPSNKFMEETIGKVLIKNLAYKLPISDVHLSDIVLKFVHFIGQWSKGVLGGHYPLTKINILKKLVELLLFPYMLKFHNDENLDDEKIGEEDIEEYEEENIWYHITKDKDVTVIDDADDMVQRYVRKVTNNIICNKGIFNSITGINRQLMRVVRDSKNLSKCETYELLWKTNKIPLLLEASDAEGVQYIQEILNSFPKVYRVVILNKSKTLLEEFQNLKVFVNINHLNRKHQEYIYKKPIQLQGREVSSSDKLNIYRDESLIKVKDIVQILGGEFNIGREFDEAPEFFIEMSLTQNIFNIALLKEVSQDLCVVRCADALSNNFEALLSNQLLIKAHEIIRWERLNKNNCNSRIIIFNELDNLEEIEAFCLTLTKSVHFFDWHGEDYMVLMKSNNINEILKKHKTTPKKPILAKELLRNFYQNKQTLIISANPGMGKSVLMNYFASNMPTHLWVLDIPLAKYHDHYRNWEVPDCDSQELNFERFLKEVVKEHQTPNAELFNIVFRQSIISKEVVFLLDGLDEVPVNRQNGAMQLIKFINQSGYYTCITTRPVLQDQLELTLNTFAITINMFTMEEQTFYLTKYFAKIGNVLPSNKNVDVFVSKLLAAAKLNLNDLDHRFTGVPLQTMLLAEVFADDFLKYLDEGVFNNEYFDLIYLYEHFIKNKITIACSKVENIPEYMIDLFIECRSFYGLRHLFDREDLQELQIDEELNVINKRLPHALQLIQKDGITVIDSDSNVTFVHRTYAEYLAANWLSDNINSAHKEVVEKLVKKTFHHNFVVVRNIFDRILAKHCPLHSAIINRQMHKVKTLITLDENAFAVKDRGGRTILHLMSAWGLHHRDDHNTYFNSPEDGTIITILNEAPKNQLKQVEDELLHYTPLEYAILSRSLRIADNLALAMKHPICKINITKKETDGILEYARKYYSVWLYIIILKCFIRTTSNEQEINSDLQKIIRKGDLDRVRCLISDQTVDVPDSNNACNLLQTAVKEGHKDIVHFLLTMKANVNKTDRNGRSALHWASYLGHLEIISILLSNGANRTATDCYDLTPSHYALFSSGGNQADIVSLLLTKETITITNWIKTILRMPTQKFNEIGNTNKIQSEKYYMNPMHLAVLLGQYEILKLILCQNLNINVKAWGGKTALMLAAQTNQIDIIQLLLTHGADIYSRDDTDQTALHHAALEGHADAVTILLTNNLDMNAKTIHNETPLHCAVFKNYQDVVSILLANGADIDQTNYKNSTPLHIAAYHDHPDLIPILLTNGAYIDPRDCKNMTPLHLAASRGNPDVVRVLLASGANIHARSSNCNTPLHLAAFEDQKDVVSILLTNGAKIEAKEIDYKTPLHVAAFKGRQEVVTILLANNADVEAKTSENKTPLYWAAENGHEHVVTILLTNGAQVDAKAVDYTTPLHLAAEQGRKDLVMILLDNGADISARNSSNKTPLDLASKRGHGDVVTILTNACSKDKFS